MTKANGAMVYPERQALTVCCPTCGQPVADSRVMVCLDTNRISYGEDIVQLSATEAEIARVLSDAYPKTIPMTKLISGVYGIGASETAANTIHVKLTHLRRKLRAIGIGIGNVQRTGYRLEIGEAA